MAIPILNHLDLRSSGELRNALLHKTTSSSASNVEAKIIYDTGVNKIKFYDGSNWQTLGTSDATGDIEGVVAGAGMTGGATSGTATLNVIGGDGITVNADEVEVTVDDSTIELSGTDGSGALRIKQEGVDTDQIATDAVTNAKIANPSITINGSAISLGGSVNTPDTNTQLSQEQVEDFVGGMLDGTETGITVSYDDTNGNIDFVVADTTVAGDSGSTGMTPGDTLTIAGGTNVTTAMSGDTLTITATDTNTQLSNEQVQDIVGGMVSGNTETGITVTYQDGDGTLDFVVGTLNQDTTGTASKVTVSDSTANTNFPVVFHDEGTGNVLLDDTGALRYNPSTGTLLVPNLNVAGTTTQVDTVTMQAQNAIVFEGATSDANETTLTITDPTADRTITLPNKSGTVALTSDLADGIFKTISVSGQDNVVADNTTDTLTLAAGSNVTITTNASSDTITIASTDTNTQLSTEQVQDIVGAMFSGNTETRVSATYQDGDGTIDLVVDDMTANTQLSFASAAEVQAGTNTTKAINPDKLAAKSVHATIDVSDSSFTSNLYAEITHSLGTEDVIVQLFDSSSKEQVYADIARTDKADSASTSKIKVSFAAAPSNDIEVLITSIKGSTAGTVAYS